MGDTPAKQSLNESIVTNTGLEVNSEWGVEITDREISSSNIDQYRAFKDDHNQKEITDGVESVRPKHSDRLILINHKRIK